ncbi:hypothetical protein LVJ82_07240 [Vitreoscilla massiliensis]|uniref:Lipoprotein n=1 Tax=Vitreoscilla massiliensis TaxID=1689272 RepID=A0ABY4E642_9NEIS|nr:hypothetical protein [Vitreoscilla massiliensis]UOO90754.1 hypothetical protein LVJ82_07240 [Vitreoscilla massiliensis]
MKLLLNITLLSLSMAVLGACSTSATPNASAQVAHKDARTLGYFSERGAYSRDKIANGFERKLLSTSRKQHWVLQDFYSINGQPQTAPFTVIDERALYDWDTMRFIDGSVHFFYPDGKKQSTIQLKQGVVNGKREVYYLTGEVFQAQQFNDKGAITEETFFERDGKRIFTLHYNPSNAEQSSLVFYDANGKEQYPNANNREQARALAEKVQAIMMELEREVYQQAGQTPPFADDNMASNQHQHP